MLDEFKKLVLRGNVIDLAVGIIIGAAFKSIVESFVNDILMPPIGFILSGVDFSDIVIVLREATEKTEAVTINIGAFIVNLIEFIIVAFALYLLVKTINKFFEALEKPKREEIEVIYEAAAPPPPPQPNTDERLLKAIQDLTNAIHTQNR
jgi:large conductance mechanosensitive channel